MNFDWGKISILIVEDDGEMREILGDVFEDRGARVLRASNGVEAFALVEKERIDLVMSDIQMPVMDGIELLRKIRKKDPKIPIVLLATGQSQLSEQGARSLGAAGLILKPFNLRSLADQVETLFRAAEAG